jgi:hypothetical protein
VLAASKRGIQLLDSAKSTASCLVINPFTDDLKVFR